MIVKLWTSNKLLVLLNKNCVHRSEPDRDGDRAACGTRWRRGERRGLERGRERAPRPRHRHAAGARAAAAARHRLRAGALHRDRARYTQDRRHCKYIDCCLDMKKLCIGAFM